MRRVSHMCELQDVRLQVVVGDEAFAALTACVWLFICVSFLDAACNLFDYFRKYYIITIENSRFSSGKGGSGENREARGNLHHARLCTTSF